MSREFDGKGKGKSFDSGYASPRREAEPARERTAEEKANDAKTIASNLEGSVKSVRDSVAAMATAATNKDHAAWQKAKRDADVAVTNLKDRAKHAPAVAKDARDEEVRAKLEGAEQAVTDANTLIAGAAASPTVGPPVVRCADLLLAALPAPAPRYTGPERNAAEERVKRLIATKLPFSDFAALATILRGHPNDPLARGFGACFGKERIDRLLEKLEKPDDKVRIIARGREAQDTAADDGAVARHRAPQSAEHTTPEGQDDEKAAHQVELADSAAREAAPIAHGIGVGVDPAAQIGAGQGAQPLPYRAELERAFDRPLGHIRARTGQAAELAPFDAQAATVGNEITLADEQPAPELVTHEVTHALQNEQAGAAPASSGVGPRDSHAEGEADANASRVAAEGFSAKLPPVTAAPAAHVQLSAAPGTPVVRLDKTKDAHELGTAIRGKDQARILEVLERNTKPEHMYALTSVFGGPEAIVDDLRAALDDTGWARARAYLGDQLALHKQIQSRDDKAAIIRELERLPDDRALALFEGSTLGGGLTIVAEPAANPANRDQPAPAPPTHAPAATTLAEVKAQLRAKLSGNEYYKALRILLAKADRALAVKQAHAAAVDGLEPGTFVATPSHVLIDPDSGSPLSLDPVARARVELAEERIRAVDSTAGLTSQNQAYFALADLDQNERRALALRLRTQPLQHADSGTLLQKMALETDDATVIRAAIRASLAKTAVQRAADRGIGLDVALERAGELVRQARAKLRQLPPDAPETERKRLQAEVERLESMFFGDRFSGKDAYEMQLAVEQGGNAEEYIERLKKMGADPVTIGRERLRAVLMRDVPALIAALRQIAPEHRLTALQAAEILDTLWSWSMSADEQELVGALIQQAVPKQRDNFVEVDGASADPGAMIVLPSTGLVGGGGPTPEATIALHDVLGFLDKGPPAAYAILARLERLDEQERQWVIADSRFQAKVESLPGDDDVESQDHDFKKALRALVGGASPAEVMASYIQRDRYGLTGHQPGPWQDVTLEKHRGQAKAAGQANLRRAYVIEKRIQQDPSLEAKLTPADKKALDALREIRGDYTHGLDETNQRSSQEITLGQPQLIDTPDAALDPNMEGSFMYLRLKELAGVPDGQNLSQISTDSPAVAEVLTAFDTLYTTKRPGGLNRGDLAQLAELYHRAVRAIDEKKRADKAENEALARIASTVAATVAAVVVTMATGGTMAPAAIAVLSAFSAGAASTIAGAAVRDDDTLASMARDFGAGAVDGAMAVAGSALAARVVHGAAAGVSAGRAATAAGGRAASGAVGKVGAKIAEGAIDGAVGGAAGELFMTATDQATWDRGVSEAFAAMLAAIARGAVTGGVLGGAIGGAIGGLGKLAARAGDDVAAEIGRLADSAGVSRKLLDDLPEAAHGDLAELTRLLKAHEFDEAAALLESMQALPRHVRDQFLEAVRAARALPAPGELGAIEIDGITIVPQIVSDQEFRWIAGSKRGDAVVIIEGGEPRIIARKGAPASAIREEVNHLAQWHGDITMRQRMELLSEERRPGWKRLSVDEKIQTHLAKLEVEADVQRRLMAQFADAAKDDPEAALRMFDAEETLFAIGQQIDKVRGAAPGASLKSLGLEDAAPRLFSDGIQSQAAKTEREAWWANQVREHCIGKNPEDPAVVARLKQLGYIPDQVNGQFRFRRNSKVQQARNLPHLSVEVDDTGTRRIVEPTGGQPNFAEQKADAARKWTASQEALAGLNKQLNGGKLTGQDAIDARREITESGPAFRDQLERRIVNGTLDEGSAGLIAKWGHVLEQLESRSRDYSMAPLTLDSFLDTLRKEPLRAVDVDNFRQLVRERTVDYLMAVRAKDPVEAQQALYDMLAIHDESSRGHLFTAFREQVMRADPEGAYTVAGKKPPPFEGSDLKKKRTPDDVVDIRADVENRLPGGRYAIEDKTGPKAFDIEQARDYAKRSDPSLARREGGDPEYGAATGGFKRTQTSTTSEYDGLVYVFSRKSEADAALRRMNQDKIIAPKLNRHPGGIHVMCLDDKGDLAMVTELPVKATRSDQ